MYIKKEFLGNLAVSAAAGDKKVPGQKLGLENIGLVSRVELEHLPTKENAHLTSQL